MINLNNATITIKGEPIETTNKSTPDYIDYVLEFHSDIEVKKGMLLTMHGVTVEVVEVDREDGFVVAGCKTFIKGEE